VAKTKWPDAISFGKPMKAFRTRPSAGPCR